MAAEHDNGSLLAATVMRLSVRTFYKGNRGFRFLGFSAI